MTTVELPAPLAQDTPEPEYLAPLGSFRPLWRIRHFNVTKIGTPPLKVGTYIRCRFPFSVTGSRRRYLRLSKISHQDGGRVFLIFVANPRTVRSCSSAARELI